MWCDSEGAGVVLGLKDNVWSSLPPVGSFFDDVVCRHALCMLSCRCCNSSRQYEDRGVLTIWDDETDVDASVDSLSNAALVKTKEENHLDFWRFAGSLIVGWKR